MTNDLQRLQRLREYLQQGGPLAVTPLDVVDMLHEYINMVREPVPQVIPPGEKLLNLRQFEADEAARKRQLDLMERELALRERELEQQTNWQTLLQQALNEQVSESVLRQQKLMDYVARYLDSKKMTPQKFWEAMLQQGYTEDELREVFWETGYGDKIPKTTQGTRTPADYRVSVSKLLDDIRKAGEAVVKPIFGESVWNTIRRYYGEMMRTITGTGRMRID